VYKYYIGGNLIMSKKQELYKGARVIDVDMVEVFKNPEKYKNRFKSHSVTYLKKVRLDENRQPVEEAIRVDIFPLSDHWAIKQFNELYPEPRAKIQSVYRHKITNETPQEKGLSNKEARNSPDYVLVQEYNTLDEKYQEAKKKREYKLMLLTYMIVFNLLEDNNTETEPLFYLKDKEREEWEKAFDKTENTVEMLGITMNQLNDLFEAIRTIDTFRTEGD
jgi:hypothetical protein